MSIKCEECGKDVRKLIDPWNNWLKLAHFLEYQYNQEEITTQTYESLLDALVSFKQYISAEEERREKYGRNNKDA